VLVDNKKNFLLAGHFEITKKNKNKNEKTQKSFMRAKVYRSRNIIRFRAWNIDDFIGSGRIPGPDTVNKFRIFELINGI